MIQSTLVDTDQLSIKYHHSLPLSHSAKGMSPTQRLQSLDFKVVDLLEEIRTIVETDDHEALIRGWIDDIDAMIDEYDFAQDVAEEEMLHLYQPNQTIMQRSIEVWDELFLQE